MTDAQHLRSMCKGPDRPISEPLVQVVGQLEGDRRVMHDAMADPAFYRQESGEITDATARLEILEEELREAYQRWEILEELNEGA